MVMRTANGQPEVYEIFDSRANRSAGSSCRWTPRSSAGPRGLCPDAGVSSWRSFPCSAGPEGGPAELPRSTSVTSCHFAS